MRKIHTIVRYLGISDGNMQEGSFRCDANVSVRRRGEQELGTRAELKNLNSFRFVEKAINFEIERQIDVLEDGGRVVQETRLYDSDDDETRPMRSKEDANDYRYFPDPDLLPVEIDDEYVDAIRGALPELPDAKRRRFAAEYRVRENDAEILTANRALADYFEAVAKETASSPQVAANWIIGDVSASLNRDGLSIGESRVSSRALAGLLDRIEDNTISGQDCQRGFRGDVGRGGRCRFDHRWARLEADYRHVGDRCGCRCRHRGEPVASGRVSGRQGEAHRLLCRPGDERNRRQSESGSSQSSAPAQTRRPLGAPRSMATDIVLPFVFENIPVRGAVVQLKETWQRLQRDHRYAPAVSSTLGEAAAATMLIVQGLKSLSTVTLQITGGGPLSMLVMQATSALEIRGLASTRDDIAAKTFRELVADGHCAITVDSEQSEHPYQGIVDISGDTLARCLEGYYLRSAQIPSHLALAATDEVCGGILLQQMPGRELHAEDDWQRLGLLAGTLHGKDLHAGINAGLIGRVFAEDDVACVSRAPRHVSLPLFSTAGGERSETLGCR